MLIQNQEKTVELAKYFYTQQMVNRLFWTESNFA